jgi:hypothetical protein
MPITISTALNSKALLNNNNTLTGTLIHNTTTDNQISIINSSANSYNNIKFTNNLNNSVYVGFACIGSGILPYYASNLFFDSSSTSIVFNTNNNTNTTIPRMIILPNGKVGIGTDNPSSLLDVRGSITSIYYASTDNYNRFGFINNGFFISTAGGGFSFRNSSDSDIVTINNNGEITTSAMVTSASYDCVNNAIQFNAEARYFGWLIFMNFYYYTGNGFAYLRLRIIICNVSTGVVGYWFGHVAIQNTGGNTLVGTYLDVRDGLTNITLDSVWDDYGDNFLRVNSSYANLRGGTCYVNIYG